MKIRIIHFTGAIALSVILAGCVGPKRGPKATLPDEIIEKEADHTWEVTDQASFAAAASGINNAGENKKHIIAIKGSFAAKSSYSTAFYITAKKVAIVLEGDATISFSSDGTRAKSLFSVNEEQAITVRDVKLQGSNSNSYPLVMVWGGGKFIMEGTASVQGNTARVEFGRGGGCNGYKDYPGGVAVNSGTFIMRGNSSVTGNNSVGGCNPGGEGGGVAVNGGTFIMQDDASVTGNTAVSGGGVYAKGTFIMQGNAKVSGNTASSLGGGIYGRVTMRDNASVTGNTARIAGGGVGVYGGGGSPAAMHDNAKVSGNTAQTGNDVCRTNTVVGIIRCE
jgi:predicted ribosomally synthesized peptide with SipW-like signal peptide